MRARPAVAVPGELVVRLRPTTTLATFDVMAWPHGLAAGLAENFSSGSVTGRRSSLTSAR